KQLEFYSEVSRIVHVASAWFLRNGDMGDSLSERIEALRKARHELEPRFDTILPDYMRDRLAERRQSFADTGAPAELAARLAMLGISELIPDVAAVGLAADARLSRAALVYFSATERFRIGRMAEAVRAIST